MRKLHWPAVVIATLVLLASLTLTPREGAAGEKKFAIHLLRPTEVECGEPDQPIPGSPQKSVSIEIQQFIERLMAFVRSSIHDARVSNDQ